MPVTMDPTSQAALNLTLSNAGRLNTQTAFQTSLGGGGGSVPITAQTIAQSGLTPTAIAQAIANINNNTNIPIYVPPPNSRKCACFNKCR